MERKNQIYIFISLMLLVTLATFIVASNLPNLTIPVSTSEQKINTLNYEGYVCVSTTGDFGGRKTPASQGINELVGCNHNVITYAGLNATRDILGQNINFSSFRYIALGNETATAASASHPNMSGADLEHNSFGLGRAAGTYATTHQTSGNWSISHTFTSTTESIVTNVTGLFNQTFLNDSTAGLLFAENRFNTVTLDGTSGDQITINWTLMVT